MSTTTPTIAGTPTPTVAASTATATAENQPRATDLDKHSTSIWKPQELEILRQHIEGYKAEAKERRGKYVVKQVYALIKALWVDRYNEENMRKEKGIKDEWKKKKSVRSLLSHKPISYIFQVGHLQLVPQSRENRT